MAFGRLVPRGTLAALALTAIGLLLASPALATTSASGTAGVQSVEYRLPFEGGQGFPVNQGWHGSYSHFGLSAYAYDFGLPARTPVVAAAPGVVAFTQSGRQACGGAALRDDANFVTINHADGTATVYAHLSTVSVQVGDVVKGGQPIGLSGNTGFTDCQAHLHFARQAQGRPVTQSQPIYFAEYGHRELPTGKVATSDNPGCVQTESGMPTGAFCGIYSIATDLGGLEAAHVDGGVRLETSTDAGAASAPTSGVAVLDDAPSRRTETVASLAGGRHATGKGPVTATWVGRFTFPDAGQYTFNVTCDHDVRLWIDGALVVNAWDARVRSPEYQASRSITAGPHVIRVDYRSGSAPLLRLAWLRTPDDAATRTIF